MQPRVHACDTTRNIPRNVRLGARGSKERYARETFDNHDSDRHEGYCNMAKASAIKMQRVVV
jgi:hypothetical protein